MAPHLRNSIGRKHLSQKVQPLLTVGCYQQITTVIGHAFNLILHVVYGASVGERVQSSLVVVFSTRTTWGPFVISGDTYFASRHCENAFVQRLHFPHLHGSSVVLLYDAREVGTSTRSHVVSTVQEIQIRDYWGMIQVVGVLT